MPTEFGPTLIISLFIIFTSIFLVCTVSVTSYSLKICSRQNIIYTGYRLRHDNHWHCDTNAFQRFPGVHRVQIQRTCYGIHIDWFNHFSGWSFGNLRNSSWKSTYAVWSNQINNSHLFLTPLIINILLFKITLKIQQLGKTV